MRCITIFKHKFLYKKLVCLTLTLLIALSISACGNGWDEEQEAVPMGRFVEETVDLPDIESGMCTAFRKSGDGKLYGILMDNDSYFLARLENGTLTRVAAPWLDSLTFANEETIFEKIENFDFRPGGGAYIVTIGYDGTDQENPIITSHIYLAEDTGCTEITPPDWSAVERASGFFYGDGAIASVEGGFVIYDVNRGALQQYKESGELACSYPGVQKFFVNGEQLWTISSSLTLRCYDSGKPTPIKEIAYTASDTDALQTSIAISPSSDGGLFLADTTGIHRYSSGSETAETVADAALNSMGAPSFRVESIIAEADDSIYIQYRNIFNGPLYLNRYRFRDDIPAYPQTELTVYSQQENVLLQEGAIRFQQDRPDVRVTIQTDADLLAEGDSANSEDVLRMLNTELLSGKGPDILLLDGLPAQNYIENGILLDMTETLQPLLDSGELSSNILESIRYNQGVYALPLRWSVPLFFGNAETLQGDTSLNKIAGLAREYLDGQADWETEHPDEKRPSFLYPVPYASCIKLFYSSRQETLLSGGEIERDELLAFLNDLKAVSDAMGLQGNEIDASAFANTDVLGMNATVYGQYMFNKYYPDARKGRAASVIPYLANAITPSDPNESLISMFSFYSSLEGLTVATLEHTALPSTIAAVRKTTAQPELATEFIRLLASQELQTTELGDGLPINALSMKTRWNSYIDVRRRDSGSAYVDNEDGTRSYLQFPSLTDEEISECQALLDSASQTVLVDNTLQDIFISEISPFLQDNRTADKTADAIISKAKLYLSE